MSPRDLLIALLVMFIWGVNFVAIKIGVEGFPPLLMTGLRFLFTVLPAIFFIRKPDAPWALIAAFGLLLGAVKFGTLFTAMKLGMPAGLTSLTMQLQVFFTMLLAFVFLGERAKRFQILGAIIAFGGIGIVFAARLDGAVPTLPFLMTIGAAFAWGLANIVIKKAGKVDTLAFLVWSSLFSPIPLFAMSYFVEGWPAISASLAAPRLGAILALLFIIGPSTLFAFAIWNRMIQRYPTAVITPFALLIPVFGILSGVIFLGETIAALALAGCGVVFLGLAVNVFGDHLFARPALEGRA